MSDQQLRELLNWISRMPDAGFNSDSPRWDWWSEGVKIRDAAESELEALLSQVETLTAAIQSALNELGVPDDDYPAPVANAVEILLRAAVGVVREPGVVPVEKP